jgi:hypothetical protein
MQFLFIAMDDENKAHIEYATDEAGVLAAVQRAMFGAAFDEDGPEDDDDVNKCKGVVATLLEDGLMRFEGDPPLHLFRIGTISEEHTHSDYADGFDAGREQAFNDAVMLALQWSAAREPEYGGHALSNYAEELKRRAALGVQTVEAPSLTDAQIDAIWHRMGSFWPNDHRYFAREILKAAFGVTTSDQDTNSKETP